MGLLDGIFGGAIGAGLVTAINKLIEQNGGIEGLAKQFQEHGLGGVVQSWISTGENQPIAPDQVSNVLGPNLLQNIAAKVGMSPEELSKNLAEYLPKAIDKLTPHGKIEPT